jgi:hypothetical protein
MATDSTLDLFARLPAGSQPIETSEAAADKLERSGALAARRWNVLLLFASWGEHGGTADDVEAVFREGHNATSPRVTELLALGYLERLDGKEGRPYQRRTTRHGGTAFVHVITAKGRQFVARRRAA